MTDAAVQRNIGEPGLPVRAVVFSGGLLDTVMQLGVVHALLVTRALPPDMAVGVSAGAVNAVALAEVLEAGKQLEVEKQRTSSKEIGGAAKPEDPDVRLNSQIARFRQILDNYRRAPGEIIDALLPDPFQVEAQRPLQPLQLPIQQDIERGARLDALRSRAGMINLYNKLLDMRLSIGTLARAVRVYLGFVEAGETRDRRVRFVQQANQCVQAWLEVGTNLFRLAPLVPSLLAALFNRRPSRVARGYTAAEVMFQSAVSQPVANALRTAGSLLLLAIAWVGISAIVLLTPAAVAQFIAWILPDRLGVSTRAVILMMYTVVAIGITAYARPLSLRGPGRAISFGLSFVLLLIGWSWAFVLGVALAAGIVFLLDWAIRGGDWSPILTLWTTNLQRFWAIGWFAIILLGLGVWMWSRRSRPSESRPLWSRLLEQYDLHDSLFNEYPLQQLFVRLFDPHYYGGAGIEEAVEQALSDSNKAGEGRYEGKSVGAYTKPRVGLTVADVSSGELQFLEPDTRVVKGLLAATARVPFFRAQAINGRTFVDGTNIANEPTRALLDYLRSRLNPDATVVHVYTVAPLPVTETQLGGPTVEHETRLVDVIRRALQLQRYRDATLERRLTEIYSKTIPGDKVLYPEVPADAPEEARPNQFIRAWVHAIEPDAPLGVTQRILNADSNEQRREIIDETVAAGCRAALQVMMQPAIAEECRKTDGCDAAPDAKRPMKALERPVVLCRAAVRRHLNNANPALPGSGPESSGPGLAEICSLCSVVRQDHVTGQSESHSVSLRVPKPDFHLPPWPSVLHRDAAAEQRAEQDFDMKKRTSSAVQRAEPRVPWPKTDQARKTTDRPLVNLLFSGGVFRGVYQIGVLNALSELEVRPDVVAGASVGTITAAMAARALVVTNKDVRRLQIARLAATYLALDRVILTDRFADFIRNFTLRAGATRLSLRQADRVFRRYDRPRRGDFERELRVVVAGLERLFYLSPFELKTLVEAIRDRRTNEVYSQLRRHLQEWLNRSGIESEVLGAEPLALLIREHVIDDIAREAHYSLLDVSHVPFDVFLTYHGLCLLATATNLTQGRLEILGDRQLEMEKTADKEADNPPDLTLLDGLLASSAFPGVFRPREAWELQRGTNRQDQYIDGGVIDNLPLDAVAEFLQRAAGNDWIRPRPQQGPHLLFSASLQTDLPRLTDGQIIALRDNWPTLWGRAKKLGYNLKLDVYGMTQRDIRTIFNIEKERHTWTPLDLEVVTVRPKWLCGTFAFHPMLGFRRAKQAASIAHGCATTLVQLGRFAERPETAKWAAAWGMKLGPLSGDKEAPLVPHNSGPDRCWFRPDLDCPFSPGQLKKLTAEGLTDGRLKERTVLELESIYHACGQAETHQAQ